MDLVIAFVLGGLAVVLFRGVWRMLARKGAPARDAADDSAAEDSAGGTDSEADEERGGDVASEVGQPHALRRQLYSIASDLDDYFEQTAQPGDLLGHPDFVRGVGLLSGESFSVDELLSYYTGDNQIVACLALEALARRRGSTGQVLATILEHLSSVGYWARFFALRTLDLRVSEPILMPVLSRLDKSWVGRFPAYMLKNFVEARAEKEPAPTLDRLRLCVSDEQLEFLEEYLRELGAKPVAALHREIVEWRRTHADRTLLRSVGKLWEGSGDAEHEVVVEHDSLVRAVSEVESSLHKAPRRSILLVADVGAGKTSVLRFLARRLNDKGWLVFEAGATELMAGQIYIGELEKRVKELIEHIGGERKVLWVVPDLQNLLWAGRHRYSPTGLLDLLLPSLECGDVVMAAEAPPESYEVLTRNIPRIRSAFDAYRVEPLDDEATLDLAREWSRRVGSRRGMPSSREPISEDLLREAFQLARQYLGNQAAPGNLLGLLQRTVQRLSAVVPAGDLRVSAGDVLATLAGLTGLPYSILDDRERLDLANLRDFFQRRVLGQPEAVDCLVERVAMIKAGLTDPTRPQGVFLFAGPTGTGKTEIAKALTEFLFGSDSKMVRLDMSEYNTRDSMRGILGDDEAHSQGTALVHQIRQQPFAVILLDEFEKAEASIWDLFLQIFDDGRLTDKRGNTSDFRHSIIIMTTNLGGDVTERAGMGFSRDGELELPQTVAKAIGQVFRKEFINRIDRVVAFRPLDRSTMREILYRELDLILKRRGLRSRSWAVEWEDSAIAFLLERGFDSNLGARPLKRAIERYLLSPLAITIVNHQFPDGDQFLFVRSDGQKIIVEFIDPDAPEAPEDAESPSKEVVATESQRELSLREIARDARGFPGELEFLRRRYAELESYVGAEAWRSKKEAYLGQMAASGFWESPDRYAVLGQAEYMDRIEVGLSTAGSLIRRLSEASTGGRTNFSRDLMRRLAHQIYLLDEALSGLKEGRPRDAFILLRSGRDAETDFASVDEFARKLAGMYRGWASKRRMDLQILEEESGNEKDPYSILMAISGYAAYTILEAESGLHVFEVPGERRQVERYRVRVRVVPQPDTPAGHGRRDLLRQALEELRGSRDEPGTVVRHYRDAPSPLVRDSVRQWRTGKLNRVLEGEFDLMGH